MKCQAVPIGSKKAITIKDQQVQLTILKMVSKNTKFHEIAHIILCNDINTPQEDALKAGEEMRRKGKKNLMQSNGRGDNLNSNFYQRLLTYRQCCLNCWRCFDASEKQVVAH